MGYVDGKTDADLLLEEADVMEERERVMVLKVPRNRVSEDVIHLFTHMHARMARTHAYTHTHTRIHTHTRARTHTHTRHAHMHVRTHTHTRTHTCARTHAHTRTQSCCQAMKELTDRLQLMLVEARELEVQMSEFKTGLREQVDAILTTPPHRSIAFHQREEDRDLINLEWSEEYTAGTGRPVRVTPPPPS